MQRYFNTEGQCKPDVHYMVGLEDRLDKIKRLYVDRGKYFVINRGRQYGKTTTLRLLTAYLKDEYIALFIDFQKIGTEEFQNAATFIPAFIDLFSTAFHRTNTAQQNELLQPLMDMLENEKNLSLRELFTRLGRLCENAPKPVVLMIDEVDSASNNQVFLDFLAVLRGCYLDRDNSPIFQSVILAGVYDIKNLKLKLRPDSKHQYNSPWNIAADFNIDMGFSARQIADMLGAYEADYQTGMDVAAVAKEIYQYTSGYPYLVSAICKMMDERLPEFKEFADGRVWCRDGIVAAVNIILKSNTPLFDSMTKQLDTYKDLRQTAEEILYLGKPISYSPDIKSINIGAMFGYFKEENGHVMIANRIFEMRMLNMFIAAESLDSTAFAYGQRDRNRFVRNGKLDMDLVLEKFVEYFHDIYGDNDEKFIEAYGRKFFLLYLKPIINGTGNYYLEAQTRDSGRTDVIIDYLGEQFVVELKIRHGTEYNERGEEQLIGYLEYFHRKKGYMLSFNFNKKKQIGVKTITLGDRTIIEAVV